jgi:hypothetical protein
MGYGPAQAMASRCLSLSGEERFALALNAAVQGNRDGLFCIGQCFEEGAGCGKDERRAAQYYGEAAELGQADAQFWLGESAYGTRDWERYMWWGRACARGNTDAMSFLFDSVMKQLQLFEAGTSGRILFEIGAACRGHVDVKHGAAFGHTTGSWKALHRAVTLFGDWTDNAKRAAECWVGVGRRLSIVKDIRMTIARMIWERRCVWGDMGKGGTLS